MVDFNNIDAEIIDFISNFIGDEEVPVHKVVRKLNEAFHNHGHPQTPSVFGRGDFFNGNIIRDIYERNMCTAYDPDKDTIYNT
jgi:hypothetical protein